MIECLPNYDLSKLFKLISVSKQTYSCIIQNTTAIYVVPILAGMKNCLINETLRLAS